LFQEVLHAALSTPEMVEKDLAHDAPPKSRAPAERSVDVRDADDAFADQMIYLAGKGSLQPVGDMTRHLLVKADGFLAQRRIKFRSAPDRLLGGLRSADDSTSGIKCGGLNGCAMTQRSG